MTDRVAVIVSRIEQNIFCIEKKKKLHYETLKLFKSVFIDAGEGFLPIRTFAS